MSKIKLLYGIIAALVIANILLVSFLFLPQVNQGRTPEGPKRYIIQKLDFDDAQIKQYEAIITEHRKAITLKDEQILDNKNRLFNFIIQPNDSLKQQLIDSIGIYQSQVVQIHFNHFKDIEQLCKPSQKASFQALTKELGSLFHHGPRKHPNP